MGEGTRPIVFFAPLIALALGCLLSVLRMGRDVVTGLAWFNTHAIGALTWLYVGGALLILVIVLWAAISPIQNVKIGGPSADPVYRIWDFFAMTLAASVGPALLYWSAAEPISHLHGAPAAFGAPPGSDRAAVFALAATFLHWTIAPFAIYAAPTLAFALSYQNRRKACSFGGVFGIDVGNLGSASGAQFVDALALFALVSGLAAAFGNGLLTLGDGLARLTGDVESGRMLAWTAGALGAISILSVLSSINRGVRMFSDLLVKIAVIVILFLLLTGPLFGLLRLGVGALVDFVWHFPDRSLHAMTAPGDEWSRWWTISYWSNWLAWAPVTGIFIGRIARGYTVQAVVMAVVVFPSLFVMFWLIAVAGGALLMDGGSGSLFDVAQGRGAREILHALIEARPLAQALMVAVLLLAFLAIVTTIDSSLFAIGALSVHGDDQRNFEIGESRMGAIIVWGLVITVVGWLAAKRAGVEGLQILATFGGIPGLFLCLGCALALLRYTLSPGLFAPPRKTA